MEIKDIMEQKIRTINLLKGAKEISLNSILGDVKVLDIIREEYNCLLEWLIEGMTEVNLHDLYNEESFLIFWETFKCKAKYNQEHFIDVIPGINLLDLFRLCKESDIFEVAYNKIEEEFVKMDKTIEEINKQMEEDTVEDDEAKNDN